MIAMTILGRGEYGQVYPRINRFPPMSMMAPRSSRFVVAMEPLTGSIPAWSMAVSRWRGSAPNWAKRAISSGDRPGGRVAVARAVGMTSILRTWKMSAASRAM